MSFAAPGGLTAGPEELRQDAGGLQEGRDPQPGLARRRGTRSRRCRTRPHPRALRIPATLTGGGQRGRSTGKPESQEQVPELHEVLLDAALWSPPTAK